jgi:hypothetical protein
LARALAYPALQFSRELDCKVNLNTQMALRRGQLQRTDAFVGSGVVARKSLSISKSKTRPNGATESSFNELKSVIMETLEHLSVRRILNSSGG